MIWKHFEHLAQPGTAQCFPYCAAYETYIVLCRKLGWHVHPGILLSVSHLSTSVLGLHCSCYCVWLHVCSEDSESGPHTCAASTSTHCAISLAPNNCYGTNQLHMLWQAFHFSSISTNIEGSGSTRQLTCSNYFLFCSDHLNKSCLKQSLFKCIPPNLIA